jgi:hypothetical protein
VGGKGCAPCIGINVLLLGFGMTNGIMACHHGHSMQWMALGKVRGLWCDRWSLLGLNLLSQLR